MKKTLGTRGIICFIILIFGAVCIHAEEGTGTTLSRVSAEIDAYKGRIITLELRLKVIDRIFEKITFYDSDNHDIEFDVSGRSIKKKLRDKLLNSHEGMLYLVTFRVEGAGKLGGLTGELEDFSPVILEKIPE